MQSTGDPLWTHIWEWKGKVSSSFSTGKGTNISRNWNIQNEFLLVHMPRSDTIDGVKKSGCNVLLNSGSRKERRVMSPLLPAQATAWLFYNGVSITVLHAIRIQLGLLCGNEPGHLFAHAGFVWSGIMEARPGSITGVRFVWHLKVTDTTG